MKVREVMHASVISVAPTDRLSVAAQRMVFANIRHLPVVEGREVVGLLNERNLVAHCSDIGFTDLVSSIMETPVTSTHPNEDVQVLMGRMRLEQVDGVPVIEAGRLVGLITTTDLLAHVVRCEIAWESSEPTVEEIMTHDPDTASPGDLFLDGIGRMTHRGVRHLPIIDGDGHVVGMLSDRDVRSTVGEFIATEDDERHVTLRMEFLRIADVVHAAPYTILQSAPVSQLVRLLVDHRIGAVPVIDDQDRLVGIASYIDVLRNTRPAANRTESTLKSGIKA